MLEIKTYLRDAFCFMLKACNAMHVMKITWGLPQ
uniref:Uncharacterized protein n=1 Tax=Rhizophora mucronata TaxID=61149 RepID=A0A2P2PQ29_RHIMU